MRSILTRKPAAFLYVVIALALPLLFNFCSKKRDIGRSETPLVIASIPPLEYFAREIGGDDVRIICMAPAGADPETFEPSVASLRKASDGSLFITVGLLPFEDKVARTLSDENPDIATLRLSESINLILGTHGHDEADPHIWGSYRNARKMAAATLTALVEVNPRAADRFQKRFERLDARLDSLDRVTVEKLAPLRGKSFLVWHPSLSYFARDYGLDQIAVGHEHKESSATDLRQRLETAAARDALVFFYQQEMDSRQSEAVTAATGLRPVSLSPLSADIETTLREATDALTKPAN